MQIIGELEGEARGAYTGSLGYLNTDGDMDFNILIRTATLIGHGTAASAPAPASSPIPTGSANWRRPAPRRKACCAPSGVGA